jgi:hypothetical protein
MLVPSMTRPAMISGIPGGVDDGDPGGVAGVAFSETVNWMVDVFAFPAASYALTTTT